jgi:glutamate-1-semialdehyde 2,1-aminomutase
MQATKESESSKLFKQAKQILPGGVNSPVRAFKAVGGEPLFMQKAQGAYLYDVDGQRYIDYVGSWGPMILGHAHPTVIQAVHTVANHGLSFGAPCELETHLADLIQQHLPSMEKMRFVSSGTEATMSAIRLARAFTQRDKIIKFNGCYHGHADSFLVNAGSGALTLGQPSSPGVTAATAADTLSAEFNRIETVQQCFDNHPNKIAAVIIEPIAGNMNMLKPLPEFLTQLKTLCQQQGALLIFDEVMTGFRVGLNGAQGLYDITPDLTTLGKVIGGGMPVGAFGGRAEIMNQLAPLGPVYQAGTLSGNPVAMAAGIATLQQLSTDAFAQLSARTEQLTTGLTVAAKEHQVALSTANQGGMFGLHFNNNSTASYFTEVQKNNNETFRRFFHGMLEKGYYFAPSAFEAGFVSLAHTSEDIINTVNTASQVFELIH